MFNWLVCRMDAAQLDRLKGSILASFPGFCTSKDKSFDMQNFVRHIC